MISHKMTLPFLETMITQVCNMSCLGCTNYSDLKHSGYVSWDQGKQWISDWLNRVNIPDFGIIGGEPLINPECKQWLIGLRELIPHAQIRFTTNGLLLDRNQELIDLMYELGNISFKITAHINTPEIDELIDSILKRYPWTPVREFGIDRWLTHNDFRFHVKRPETFVKTYRNNYSDMLPWNSDPTDAFDNCVQQTCPLLHQGKIYKCSTSGLLSETVNRVAPGNLMQWDPYIVSGLDSNCSDQDLKEFIDNFGKPHSQCGQCPSKQSDSVISHLNYVTLK